MKKQLLIAAVAATMSVSALADISISGAAKVNYTYSDKDDNTSSNAFKNEMDLKVKGTNGDTTIVMNFTADEDGASTVGLEDTYVATKVGDVSLKVGDWDNGNNALRDSARGNNKLSASTSFGGVGITYDANAGSDSETVKLSGEIAGVKVSYKEKAAGEDISLSTSISGLNISYLAINSDTANSDRNVVEVSTTVGGIGLKIAQANADSSASIGGDTWMGDFEVASTDTGSYQLSNDQDVQSIELSTSMGGNTVKFRNTQVDGVAGEDTSFNKVIITRPLANGTTFEATYTDLDDDAVTTDGTTIDLELAVKF